MAQYGVDKVITKVTMRATMHTRGNSRRQRVFLDLQAPLDGVMMTPRLVSRATRDGEELYHAEFTELARPIEADTAREVARVKEVPLEDACAAVSATSNEVYGPW